MKLVVTTPDRVLLDRDDVVSVTAEDATGRFGILSGHADFLTVLTLSVLSWRDRSGAVGHVAVRGGVFSVQGGRTVALATREAVPGDDLARLETEVVASFRRAAEEERRARTESARLELRAIQQIRRYLEAGSGRGVAPGGPLAGGPPSGPLAGGEG